MVVIQRLRRQFIYERVHLELMCGSISSAWASVFQSLARPIRSLPVLSWSSLRSKSKRKQQQQGAYRVGWARPRMCVRPLINDSLSKDGATGIVCVTHFIENLNFWEMTTLLVPNTYNNNLLRGLRVWTKHWTNLGVNWRRLFDPITMCLAGLVSHSCVCGRGRARSPRVCEFLLVLLARSLAWSINCSLLRTKMQAPKH